MPDDPNSTDLLLTFVRESPDAVCPVCRYRLLGLTTPRCPECGVSLRLAVGSADLKLGAWLLALISCCLAIGFDGVIALVMLGAAALHGFPPTPFAAILGVFSGLALVFGVSLAALLVKRVAWMKLSPRTQWRIGVGVFAVVTVVHTLWGSFLFVRM